MAYDGMYGELSTRGTANQILDQILQVQDEVETTQDEIEATAQLVDQNSQEAVAARDAAIAARDAANASADSASLSADSATLASGNAAGSAVEANNSAAAAAISETNAAASAAAAEAAAESVIIGGPRIESIADATMVTNDMLIATSASAMGPISTGAFGRSRLADATQAAALTGLGLTRPVAIGNTNLIDFNTLVNPGWQAQLYSASSPNAPTQAAGGGSIFWYVFTVNYFDTSTVLQMAFPYGTSNSARGRIAWRNLYIGNWTSWRYTAASDDLGTAAAATLTTSNEDATTGRVLKVGDFGIGRKELPLLTGNNETFSFEGGVTSGWSLTNMTVTAPSTGGSVFTKTVAAGAGGCQAERTIVYPQNSGDYILFGKVTLAVDVTGVSAISIIGGSSTQQMSIWFNSTNASTGTAGGVSIRGTVAGVTQTASLGVGFPLASGLEFALQYDNKWQTCTAWYKHQTTGRWIWGARIACDRHQLNLNVAFGSVAALNTTMTVEYLSVAAPNIVVWGDSIAEGKNLYSPNPALSLTDWTSHWASYVSLYRGLRNNLPVVKGVGGRSSLVMESNLAEIESLGAQVVFFHASSNDNAASVTQTARTTSMQNQLNRLNRRGAQVVLLNAMQATLAAPDNAGPSKLKDYTDLWWTTYRPTLVGVYSYFDIAAQIALSGYQDPAYTQADGIHPNPAGYALIGAYINGALSPANCPKQAAAQPLVGTVVNTSGVATGAVIERGSNANGDYIRYADGTQICWKTFSTTTAISTAAGSVFFSGALDAGNWAATFSVTPVRSLFSDGSAWQLGSTGLSTTAIGTFQLVRHITTASSTYNISVIGVGRWF